MDKPADAGATPDGIVRCINEAWLLAADYPPATDSPEAQDAGAQSQALTWVALDGLAAMTRRDRRTAYLTLAQVENPGAVGWFAMSAVAELAESGWTSPWPDSAFQDDDE